MAERRWGPRVAGLLTSFPIVTGPILFFFSMEQGDVFTAEAARGAIVAQGEVRQTGLAYACASVSGPMWMSVPAGWAHGAARTLALHGQALPVPRARRPARSRLGLVDVLLPIARVA